MTEAAKELAPRLGPAESALARQLASALGAGDPLVVEASQNRAVGDFRVRSPEPDRTGCSDFAERLAALPLVDSATAVPPNVYIRPALDALQAAVVEGVLREGTRFGTGGEGDGRVVQVQFSCPNFNKSLHLGHLRNNVLGAALANAFAALGYRVVRTEQPSEWGRHIAKACVGAVWAGWPDVAAAATTKPDRLVGEFYSACNQALDDPERGAAVEAEVDAMMGRLEEGDPEALALCRSLTDAAYSGIRQTYDRIGTRFDAELREGDTLDIAKRLIAEHLGTDCSRRDDGSVFIDLGDVGLREVTLLRREGWPLLHCYFLGASTRRHALWPGTPFLFVMGREYAPTVPELVEIVRRLSSPEMAANTEAVFHGMVSVGAKKMSSRGDAVDVDGLLDLVTARLVDEWQAGTDRPLDGYQRDVAERLGVALVKYHFLRPPRMKDMTWSIDELWARSGPRIAHVVEVLAAEPKTSTAAPLGRKAADELRALSLSINRLPDAVRETAVRRDPSHLVRYLDDVSDGAAAAARRGVLDGPLLEAAQTAMRAALDLLGIALPPGLADLPPLARPG